MIFHSLISKKFIWREFLLLCIGFFVACGTLPPTEAPYASDTESPPPTSEIIIIPTELPYQYIQRELVLTPGQWLDVYYLGTPLPETYQQIILPDNIQGKIISGDAQFVKLPTDVIQLESLKNLVVVQEANHFTIYDQSLYDWNQPAVSLEANMLAYVINNPTTTLYDGVYAGILWDIEGVYGNAGILYNVYLFIDRIELRDDAGNILYAVSTSEENKYYIQELPEPVMAPIVVFLKNGCWCCWNIDSARGCLYCSK